MRAGGLWRYVDNYCGGWPFVAHERTEIIEFTELRQSTPMAPDTGVKVGRGRGTEFDEQIVYETRKIHWGAFGANMMMGVAIVVTSLFGAPRVADFVGTRKCALADVMAIVGAAACMLSIKPCTNVISPHLIRCGIELFVPFDYRSARVAQVAAGICICAIGLGAFAGWRFLFAVFTTAISQVRPQASDR